jgi:Zn-dependent M16 (insulinase) family peptidase
MDVLDHLLIGTSASALRKALTDSDLGASVIGGGLDTTLLQATFGIGLKGVTTEEDAAALETLILKTMESLSVTGFPQDAVEASMNTIEFQMREFNTGSFPRGLSFMLGALRTWNYDRDPLHGVAFEAPLAELKAELAAGKPVFENMLRDYFVANGHRVTLTMEADQALETAQEAAEKEELRKVKDAMSATEVDEVIRMTAELKRIQAADDSEEAKATIPKLSLADLRREAVEIPIAVEQGACGGRATVVTHDLSTSGIVYFELELDLGAALDFDTDLPLLPLFTRLLLETGAGDMDRVALSQRIGAVTGGIGASMSILPMDVVDRTENVANDPDSVVAMLSVHGKATGERMPELLSLVHTVLTQANVDDRQRVIEILRESRSRMKTSIGSSGHSYAMGRISAQFTLAGHINESTGGLA